MFKIRHFTKMRFLAKLSGIPAGDDVFRNLRVEEHQIKSFPGCYPHFLRSSLLITKNDHRSTKNETFLLSHFRRVWGHERVLLVISNWENISEPGFEGINQSKWSIENFPKMNLRSMKNSTFLLSDFWPLWDAKWHLGVTASWANTQNPIEMP